MNMNSMGSMFNRKLDHEYCISRMNYFEKTAYDLIHEDKNLKVNDVSEVVDKFISTCIAADMIVRERLYFPKQH